MKSKFYLAIALALFLTQSSCKKEETVSTQETPEAEKPKVESATPAPAPATETNTAGQPPKLNPPHGQPYHRCEIAVGAPLDGSSATPQALPTAQTSAPKSFFKEVKPTETVAPAAPSQVTQTITNGQVNTTQTGGAKITTTTTPSNSTTQVNTPKPKINPAHGQPHHRCDIKVGDPLPDA